jgi:hypothetical protein
MEIEKINKLLRQKETIGRELTPEIWDELYENARDPKFNKTIEKLKKIHDPDSREDVLSKIIEAKRTNQPAILSTKEEQQLTPSDRDKLKKNALIEPQPEGISITIIPDIKTLEKKLLNGGELSDIERKNLEDLIEHPAVKELIDLDKEIGDESDCIISDSKSGAKRKGFQPSNAAKGRAHSKTGHFYGANAPPGMEHLLGK